MKINWTLLRDLIRVDLITMRGGKNSTAVSAIGFMLFTLLIGFFVSPLGGLYLPFLLGTFFVPTLFHNEMKYHSEKLWALLPVERKDLVTARYLLGFGVYSAVGLSCWLILLLAQKLRLWRIWMIRDENDADVMDIVGLLAEKMGLSERGLFNLCYFAAFAFGMLVMSSSLRAYFKDNERFNLAMQMGGYLRKHKRGELVAGILVLAVLAFWILVAMDVLPVSIVFVILERLLLQLAHAADGFLLAVTLVTIGIFHTAFQYVSTLIEYEKKEL